MTAPPKVDGITVAKMWSELKLDPDIAKYFPPLNGRMPEKDYFFAVLMCLTPQVMESLSPGFTTNLLSKVREHKEAKQPAEAKIMLSQDMSNFLLTKKAPGIFADDKAAMYLKAGRQWATKRQTKPFTASVSLNFDPKFKSTPLKTKGRAMDAESSHK